MSNFGFLSGKDNSAVEELLSQAKDLYVLEQVAAINSSGFTDSALPTDVEARFRRLKSLPVSRTDPVPSSRKLLSHSRSMASHGNAFSAGDEKKSFSGIKRDPSVKSRPPVEETRISSGIKRDNSVNSGFEKNSRGGVVSETSRDVLDSGKIGSVSARFSRECKNFSDYGKIGSSSSRFSRDCKAFSLPTTQTMNSLPKEMQRISSVGLSHLDLEEGSNRKSKSKSKLLSMSWFDKLSPSRAMGCLCNSPSKSSPAKSKKTMKSSINPSDSWTAEERLKKAMNDIKESQRIRRKTHKLVKKIQGFKGLF